MKRIKKAILIGFALTVVSSSAFAWETTSVDTKPAQPGQLANNNKTYHIKCKVIPNGDVTSAGGNYSTHSNDRSIASKKFPNLNAAAANMCNE
jgi:hypothetical protein